MVFWGLRIPNSFRSFQNYFHNNTSYLPPFLFFIQKYFSLIDFTSHVFNGKSCCVNSPVNFFYLCFRSFNFSSKSVMFSKVDLDMNLTDQLILQDKLYSSGHKPVVHGPLAVGLWGPKGWRPLLYRIQIQNQQYLDQVSIHAIILIPWLWGRNH